MRKLKLLDAIGNIDDRLIEEAAPQKHTAKKRINWTRLGSLAACICLFLIGIWVFHLASDSLQKTSSLEMAAPESPGVSDGDGAMTEENEKSDTIIAEEPALEEESIEEEIVEDAIEDDTIADSAPAKGETSANDGTPETGFEALDTAYSFTMNGTDYYPISLDTRYQFDLLPEEVKDLITEGTYQIKESDLGEVMGTVENSENQDLIGATAYHFAKCPESNAICIVEYNGIYEFYVNTVIVSE